MRVTGEGSARGRGKKTRVRMREGEHSRAPGEQKPAGRTIVLSHTDTRAVSLVPGLCARLDAQSCVRPCVLTASDARLCVPLARPCVLLGLPK